MNNKQPVVTVSQVNQYIKNMFVREYSLSAIMVKGEVSNCKYHGSGHIYFTLKDKASQIMCVMFAGQRGGLSFRMENGQEIIVFGSINVYERDGKYQLYAKQIDLAGDGRLYEEFERLKKKLKEQGLFDESWKKPLPRYVTRVGVVTARTGAAIQDIINISTRRNPYVQLILYPAKVQGDGAAQTVADGIRALDKQQVDVIIIGRGGGSIEDLWTFNEEQVAWAIFECETPVISAVGHETDTTIADFVADMRAPTPSAAAELAVYDVRIFMNELEERKERMEIALSNRIQTERERFMQFRGKLGYLSPQNQILQKRQYLLDTEDRLWRQMRHLHANEKNRLTSLAARLEALSPLHKLTGGFAYAENEKGQMVESIDSVTAGDRITITVHDGTIGADVVSCERKDTIEWLKQ